jgi:HSP20 family protein
VVKMKELPKGMAELENRIDDVFRVLAGVRVPFTYAALPLFGHRPFMPALDVFTKDADMIVHLELPGVEPEKDVHVVIEDGDLVIRGERRQEEEVKGEDYYRMETSYGTFERRIPLPEGIDPETVKAEYADGVLIVTVPKAVKEFLAPKAKEIPIKVRKLTKAA